MAPKCDEKKCEIVGKDYNVRVKLTRVEQEPNAGFSTTLELKLRINIKSFLQLNTSGHDKMKDYTVLFSQMIPWLLCVKSILSDISK